MADYHQPVVADTGRTGWVSFLTPAVLVAIGYYLGAKLGFALTLQPVPVSTLWPPNAILLAGLVLAPIAAWPAILSVVFVAHLAIQLQTGVPLGMVLCWFVSNCTEALIGAGALRYAGRGQPSFDSVRDVAIFLCAGVLAPFLSSFLDAAFVSLNRWGAADYWTVWRTRFFSNCLATLTLVPVIVITTRRVGTIRLLPLRRWLELGAVLIALTIVCWVVFVRHMPGPAPSPAYLYAPLPLLVALAVRGGPWGASGAMLICTGLSTWGASRGHGPFVASAQQGNALAIQLFLIVTWIPVMALAAVLRERTLAELRARTSEQKLSLALEAAQLGMWDWHIASNRGSWAGRMNRMDGGDHAQSGTLERFLAGVHPDDRHMVARAVKDAVAGGGGVEAEFRIGATDNPRWIFTKGTTVCDETGAPARLVGVSLDVTDAKRAELQIQEHRRELAHLGRVSLVGELSGAIAHELNQPLAAVLTNARTARRLLAREPPDLVQVAEILEAIAKDDLRAAEVITRLRRLLRNDPPTMQVLDINDVINDVLVVVCADVISRRVSMSTRLEHNVPRVVGDRIQLQQVLLNLVINGCEAMRGRNGSRLLTLKSDIDGEGAVRVAVVDNGCGIPADQIDQIFEPFVTFKPNGVGLGLSICRSIVSAHEGRLWAENNPDGGAAFYVSLPPAREGYGPATVAEL